MLNLSKESIAVGVSARSINSSNTVLPTFSPRKGGVKSSRLAQRLGLPSPAHAPQHPTAFCTIYVSTIMSQMFVLERTFSNTHVGEYASATNVRRSIPLAFFTAINV